MVHHHSTSIHILSSTEETPGYRQQRHVQRSELIRRLCLGSEPSLRSRRQRKAWGVSPRNRRATVFEAREAGDSFQNQDVVRRFESVARYAGFACVNDVTPGVSLRSTPGFTLTPLRGLNIHLTLAVNTSSIRYGLRQPLDGTSCRRLSVQIGYDTPLKDTRPS